MVKRKKRDRTWLAISRKVKGTDFGWCLLFWLASEYQCVIEVQLAEHQLQDLHKKLKPKNHKGITIKHVSGKPHQISNTEGWARKDQFGGSVLLPRYNRLLGHANVQVTLDAYGTYNDSLMLQQVSMIREKFVGKVGKYEIY